MKKVKKDETISDLRNKLCDANIRYENALILCKDRAEQIATLKERERILIGRLHENGNKE